MFPNVEQTGVMILIRNICKCVECILFLIDATMRSFSVKVCFSLWFTTVGVISSWGILEYSGGIICSKQDFLLLKVYTVFK